MKEEEKEVKKAVCVPAVKGRVMAVVLPKKSYIRREEAANVIVGISLRDDPDGTRERRVEVDFNFDKNKLLLPSLALIAGIAWIALGYCLSK